MEIFSSSMSNSSSRVGMDQISGVDTNLCPPSVSGTTFLIAAYSVVIAVGLVGNASLIFIISKQKKIMNITNILIVNLSCSDLLMCVVCLPVTVGYTLMDRWVLGEELCKLTPFMQCTSVTVSIFSLVLIAVEQHQLILHPTGWVPTLGHSYLAIAITWTVACIISLPFFYFSILTNEPFQNLSLGASDSFTDHVVCMELWPMEQHRLIYTTFLLLFQYCVPLMVILLCYLRIFLWLRDRRDAVEQVEARRWKAWGGQCSHAMLAIVVIAFAICWLPLNIFNVVFDWHPQVLPTCQHNIIFSACHLTAMASSCINPVVYGFLNTNFQRELKASLQCPCCSGGAPESYEGFPLSAVATDATMVSSVHRSCLARAHC